MRKQLTDRSSIPGVVAELTLEEKLNLAGAYEACHTLAIPDMDILSLCLADGVTGVNGAQVVLDYTTSPKRNTDPELLQRIPYAGPEVVALCGGDLEETKEKYREDRVYSGLIEHIRGFRPDGKEFISFPSGVNIGAAFDPILAEETGRAVGWEMRRAGVDVTLGPNVDIMRDPLGGRNYEMYGEDPVLVEETAAAFIRGIQSTGVGACAKHFLANNQETDRNTKDTHVSERALREIYGRGFGSAIQRGKVKAIMSAYNAVNGKFTSYNPELLTDWLRGEWGFQGLTVSDWGAAAQDKAGSLKAGMDLILCGPNDMTECARAVEEGRLSIEVLDERVSRLLGTIVDIREEQRQIPPQYDQEALLETARKAVAAGSVLLKNQNGTLPLAEDAHVAFWGKRSRELLECGSGSTAVVTELHGNPLEESGKRFPRAVLNFEEWEGAETIVYTVTAPAGENVDRDCMDIEPEDRERLPGILREAKERGLRTVVLLNVAGPVDVRAWEPYADAVLAIFIPGCMGGAAAADLLFGREEPSGRLPMTFPERYEDTPSYPNFPGEAQDVYYGEGIFVGYRSYEKRGLGVRYPFGFGLGYTEFVLSPVLESFYLEEGEETLAIPVRVKNTGARKGSQVVQVYGSEAAPHILRPVKELLGFGKVTLEPGEERVLEVVLRREALRCFDPKKRKWVLPTGKWVLSLGTSSRDIFARAELVVKGPNPYAYGGDSTIGELYRDKRAWKLIDEFTGGMFSQIGEEQINFMVSYKLNDILARGMVNAVPDAVKLNAMLQGLYERLGQL